MPIRLVAVDLDGTLLNSRSEISARNRQALAAAAARGAHLVVVTGRRPQSARPFVAQIPCPVTLISSNGAWIGSSSGEVCHRHFLSRQVARQIVEVTREYRPYAVVIHDLPGQGQVVMQEHASLEGPLGWYLKNNPESLAQVAELETAITTDPIQVMFGGPPSRIEPVEPLLRASPVGTHVHLTWTKYLTRNVSILDVLARGCSKGWALEYWAGRSGVTQSEVMAIGDNYNDLEMLEFAGQPILMGNSVPGFLRDGWPVTLSNDEDGVAAAVEKYVLNDKG